MKLEEGLEALLATMQALEGDKTWNTPALVIIKRARRRRLRLKKGLCPDCGYDLRASEGRCPECGTISGEAPGKDGVPAARGPRLNEGIEHVKVVQGD